MKENTVRPNVIVYELNRHKYAHLSSQYKFTFFKPSMYRIPETRFDYYVTNHDHIRKDYDDLKDLSKHVVEELILKGDKLVKRDEQDVVVDNPADEPEEAAPLSEEVVEENSTEEQEEETSDGDGLDDLSWHELRAKASEAGLEGRFGKEEALEFLRNK